ncbi:unnamed protein product (macronuclear) [Paramecium tetraurelia]|uniref:Uncharacterized protein n=1 Tax=Paramecium tetraurelia TaxID=5888 RepID=A0DBN1_PARTE|nr:uncharacterized protein GSPATT00015345001 [Paramecium tetraurelia]CAK80448.1 unnamed protein product [Paramecium tetraurelia]|eukprot:XP_001447845.1 hypothetical protein (macronuclear) [Paramecium tetraurelia strain d4-2]
MHTKLPSLPNLPNKNKQFYNKWYIPYDLRYVQKPDLQKENFEGILQTNEDDMHFYKNIHSINVQYNPFDEKLPEVLIKNIGYRERTETVKDFLKGQRQIIEFKKSVERENQRVPEFIKQLLESEQGHKKYKKFKQL